MTFTIASVNVNGIRAAAKQRNEENLGINDWLAHTAADVVLMQEVRADPKQTEKALEPALAAGWHLEQAESVAKGRAGVAILSRTPLVDVQVGFGDFQDAGRYIAATTAGVRVASLYLPSGDAGTPKLDEKYRFLDQFADVLEELAAQHSDAVVGGDWNICHRAQDLKNNKANEKKAGHLPEERAFMDAVFGSFPDDEPQAKKGLGDWLGVVDYADKTDWTARTLCLPGGEHAWYDVARRLEPEADGPYTWWTYRGQAFNNDAGWRIDYQAATKSMLDRARRAWVEKAPTVEKRWSDHSPLLVEYA
ncbi:exodeoxyribonuclease III [Corynebacterium phocae]|uniref:Exodeoxyribonuclease III n=1 Tax=Corynebacterium phocae TaxID=161895 RepID=A0A1L7D508_9CORY|nr:exodeoxyribonuclease III [Corynebacterium phocae]APT93147.1 exodeoxyribonuclease III [Corynebacterium phocae]KAA8722225.1 exodeoxyribonuclease III [Corynebacterium phocae]